MKRLRLLLLIFALFATIPAKAAISIVQHTSKDAGSVTSSTLAFGSNNTAGNFIAVCIRIGTEPSITITVSDSNSNTYASALQFNDTTGINTVAIVYAANIAGGANTITVSYAGGSATLRFSIAEYSGVVTSSPVDVTGSNQGTGTALDSGSVTTTTNGDLIIGVMVNANGRTWTAGTGYTSEEQVPTGATSKLMFEDKIQSTSGAVSASATISSSDQWSAGIATFKPSAAAAVKKKPPVVL